jgi:hypothetical protein
MMEMIQSLAPRPQAWRAIRVPTSTFRAYFTILIILLSLYIPNSLPEMFIEAYEYLKV